jgi:hypothetical protein
VPGSRNFDLGETSSRFPIDNSQRQKIVRPKWHERSAPTFLWDTKKGLEMKKTLLAVSAAVILAGGLAAFSQPASAHVVCNREGDCWSTHANVQYPSSFGIRTYNDRYANESYRQRHWHDNGRTWRDENHDRDRGAYRSGAWVQF